MATTSTTTTYAAELLDGLDVLKDRVDCTLKSCAEVSTFYKRLAKIEADFSRSLAALLNKEGKRVLAVPHLNGGIRSSFSQIHQSLAEVAKAHSEFSVKITELSTSSIDTFVKSQVKAKVPIFNDAKKIQLEMSKQRDLLQKAKQAYHARCSERDDAAAAVASASADAAAAAKLPKLQQKLDGCNQKVQKHEEEYRKVLRVTNQKQTMHYTQEQSQLLNRFQAFDSDRIEKMKEFFNTFCCAFLFLPAIYQNAAEVMMRTSDAVRVQDDIDYFVSEYKTNVSLPEDYQFEEYNANAPATTASPSSGGGGGPGGKRSKPGGSSGSGGVSSSVPTFTLTDAERQLEGDERKQLIKEKRKQLEAAMLKEERTKEGLEKMMSFYKNDPVNQAKAQAEVDAAAAKLEQYEQQHEELEAMLSGSGGGGGSGGGSATGGSTDGGGGGGATTTTAAAAPSDSAAAAATTDVDDDVAKAPTLCKATAMFDYASQAEGELSFAQGDVLDIKEQDDSGWWLALDSNGRSGFVPQTYVQVD